MAISKRLRHEVMRRDNFACRYCGGTAPDVKLTIDHVTPTALGGTDDPTNLVTACADCNAGKSATPPDAAIVADVAADALRWSRAQGMATLSRALDLDNRRRLRAHFLDTWGHWTFTATERVDGRLTQVKKTVPLPDGWEDSIDRFYAAGLSADDVVEAVRIAMSARNCKDEFRYFCGVMWKYVGELREQTAAVLEAGEVEAADWYVDDVDPHVEAARVEASARPDGDEIRLREYLRDLFPGGHDGA